MFNKVVLVGNLTRDIELRYTTSGVAIGNSSIAVTRKFTANGEKREETCFIDITFFGKQAEIANQYLNKGSKLLVEGRLKFDQWTDNNGQTRSKHSVSVENMEMLGSAQGQGGFNQNSNQQGGYSQSGSYGNQNYGNQGYGQNTNSYASSGAKTPNQQSYNRQSRQDDYNDKIQDIDVDADKYDSDETIPF
ncbi:single-stranded DNA-binding protein [Campylobacter sp. RM16190]|uniref:single-stranded DNA-binding protein n=1 Tax=Campylobacter sp. RM16190 TaxID=1705727 RepID=UPI001475492B|nr:single-stranded DNA-binding protein [Campylobacter sp. RM16190]